MSRFPVIGNFAAPSASENNYAGIAGAGGAAFIGSAGRGAAPLPEAADLLSSKLKTVAPGVGKSIEFIVTKNGENTLVSLKLEGEETEKAWSGEIHFAEGDTIGLKVVPTGTPTVGPVSMESIMETESENDLYFWGTSSAANKTIARFCSLSGYVGSIFALTEEDAANVIVPMSGTIVRSAVRLSVAVGTSKKGTVSLHLNNSSDALKATFEGASEVQKIVTGSQAIAPGDLISMKCTPEAEISEPRIAGCLSIKPAVAGEHFIGIHNSTGPTASRFAYLRGVPSWNPTESSVASTPFSDLTARKLYGKLATAPGSGKKGVYALRSNGAATEASLEFKDTDTAKSYTGGDVTLTAGKTATFGFTPTSSPANPGAHHLSFVVFTEQTEPPEPEAPDVTTGEADGITEDSATLHGTVDPNGAPTTYYFEYGPTAAYGSKTAEHSAGEGEEPVNVEAALSGLEDGTEFHFRLVAINSVGETHGADKTFTTDEAPLPPGYEFRTPEATIFPDSAVAVEVPITGLEPNTEYRFRLVAFNAEGEDLGAEMTFTTDEAGAPPEGAKTYVIHNGEMRPSKRYVKV